MLHIAKQRMVIPNAYKVFTTSTHMLPFVPASEVEVRTLGPYRSAPLTYYDTSATSVHLSSAPTQLPRSPVRADPPRSFLHTCDSRCRSTLSRPYLQPITTSHYTRSGSLIPRPAAAQKRPRHRATCLPYLLHTLQLPRVDRV
jgi:hypothetical protein